MHGAFAPINNILGTVAAVAFLFSYLLPWAVRPTSCQACDSRLRYLWILRLGARGRGALLCAATVRARPLPLPGLLRSGGECD